MAKFSTELDDAHRAFIAEQLVFFTATAPRQGRLNLSPKGMDTFRCLDARTVGYLDLTGSGNETAAHLRDDGRLTIMFCSFGEKPLILRLYGRGRAVPLTSPEGEQLAPHFPNLPGARQLIVLAVESVQTSCGYGVPYLENGRERPTLQRWAEGKESTVGLQTYWEEKNQLSIDGLPTGLLEG